MHNGIKFRDFYIRVLYLLVKNAKFCTLRKFPAIRYVFVEALRSSAPSFLRDVAGGIAQESQCCGGSFNSCFRGQGAFGCKRPYRIQGERLDSGRRTVTILIVLGQLCLDRRVKFRTLSSLALRHTVSLTPLPSSGVWYGPGKAIGQEGGSLF